MKISLFRYKFPTFYEITCLFFHYIRQIRFKIFIFAVALNYSICYNAYFYWRALHLYRLLEHVKVSFYSLKLKA